MLISSILLFVWPQYDPVWGIYCSVLILYAAAALLRLSPTYKDVAVLIGLIVVSLGIVAAILDALGLVLLQDDGGGEAVPGYQATNSSL